MAMDAHEIQGRGVDGQVDDKNDTHHLYPVTKFRPRLMSLLPMTERSLRISTCAQSQSHGGHCSVFSPITKYLELNLPDDYGEAVREITILPCFAATMGQLNEAEQKSFGPLPQVQFRPKKRMIKTAFVSRVMNGYESESTKIRPDLTNQAIPEVIAALNSLRQPLRTCDAFDIDRFLNDCERVLQYRFESAEEIQRVEESEVVITPAADPWLASDLDWDDSRYHKDARRILDQPFFWSRGSDDAPHGSDTGSDLLDECELHAKSGKMDAALVDVTIQEWGVFTDGWDVVDEQKAADLYSENAQWYSVRNKVAIAIAFASIKYTAALDPQLAALALRSIARESFSFVTRAYPQSLISSHDRACRMMTAILNAYLPDKPGQRSHRSPDQ